MQVIIQLFGGIETWTPGRQKEHTMTCPEGTQIIGLIGQFANQLLEPAGRPHFVFEDDGGRVMLRPGILVMVNDTDWEFLGDSTEDKYSYVLHDNDTIQFITTLHGG